MGRARSGLYSGFLLFGVPGLLLALARWDRGLLKKAYPFGPFLLLGALLGILSATLFSAISPSVTADAPASEPGEGGRRVEHMKDWAHAALADRG